jgi:8-oxo-dGTP pyrophosphatase MutT (NUDIX family)
MTIVIDPTIAPILGLDAHLPPVAANRLRPDALRRRFEQPPAWQPEVLADRASGVSGLASASVLVPLVMHDDLTVLLTRRTSHLKAHAGQIAFPGGRVEPDDLDPVHTALREAAEEVGLPREDVEVIGELPTYTTITGFVVTPVVGLVNPELRLRPDPNEVDEAFEVPLSFLMNPAHHQRRGFDAGSGRHQFFAMPWTSPEAEGAAREYFIWGATAAMLRNLYRFLSA